MWTSPCCRELPFCTRSCYSHHHKTQATALVALVAWAMTLKAAGLAMEVGCHLL
jgi:hypothetical protein